MGISLALHGLAVGVAVVLATQVKPLLPEEVFQWDVALVEATRRESRSEQVQSVVAHHQPSAQVLPPPQPKSVPETSQAVMPIERRIEPQRPTIETVQRIESKVERSQVREEQVEQSIAEIAQPTSEPVAVAASPEPIESTLFSRSRLQQLLHPRPKFLLLKRFLHQCRRRTVVWMPLQCR